MYALLFLNLIVPFTMVFVGYLLKIHPASDMKSHNGYNTPVSRKSQAHWDYAQRIAPNIFISFGKIVGVIEIILSVVMFLYRVSIFMTLIIGICIGCGFLFLGFYKTDSEIEKFIGS